MLKLEPVALTHVGRKRSNNQDYLGDLIFKSGRKYGPEKLNERGHLFAVADGMGGYAGGEVASELAITTLFERYYNGSSTGDLGTDLSEAIRAANLKVHTEASGSGRPQMGTTLTTVLVKGNKAIFGNVGDSRTYLIRQGIPERVTHDHSLVQDQIDAGVLTPEQAERSAIKNFITRAIGHRDEVDSDLFERDIQKEDVLLLCSDGLHGLVKEIEMGTIVATAASMQEAAQTLVDLANERGGHDNISVMLIRVEDVGEPLPPILNGREPVYNSSRSLYNQTTEPLGAVTVPSNGGTTVSQSDRPTVPSPVPVGAAAATSSAYMQPTLPMTPISDAKPKGRGRGLMWGLIVLILIAGAAAAYFLLINPTTPAPAVVPTPAPAVQPTTTPTVTATPATTTPAALATATPALATTAPSSTVTNPASPVTTSAPGVGVGGSLSTPAASSGSAASSGAVGSDRRPSPSADLASSNATPALGVSAQFEVCPNSVKQGNLACWAVANLGTVSQVDVQLTKVSGEYTITLVPLDASGTPSNTPTINLVAAKEKGHFQSLAATNIALGLYRLQINHTGTANPETYNLKFGTTNLEAWAEPLVKVTQQGQVLVIQVDNKL